MRKKNGVIYWTKEEIATQGRLIQNAILIGIDKGIIKIVDVLPSTLQIKKKANSQQYTKKFAQETRECLFCQKTFISKRRLQICCCAQHRDKWKYKQQREKLASFCSDLCKVI